MRLRISTPEENRKIIWEYFHSKEWLEYYNSLTPEQKHINEKRREHYRSKKQKQILLVDTSGLNYILGIRLPTKDYKPTQGKKRQKKCQDSA